MDISLNYVFLLMLKQLQSGNGNVSDVLELNSGDQTMLKK